MMGSRNRLTGLALAIGFVVFAPEAEAQGLPEVDLAGEATATDVRLRWTLPGGVLPDSAFVVERTAGATPIRFTVPAPLPAAEATGRGLIEADVYSELVDVFTPDASLDAEARQERAFERAMLILTSVRRPGWAQVLGTVFTDTTAVTGTTYTYRVTTRVDGTPVTIGETVVTAGNVTPLPAASGLEGETDEEGVRLRWDLPEDGYLVAWRVLRRDPDGSVRDLTDGGLFVSRQPDPETGEPRLPEVFLRDTAVAANATYAYVVIGVNLFGRETPPSDTLTVFFPDPVPLDVPLVTAVDVRDRETELFWQPPSDPRVAGVGVLRSEDPAVEGSLLTPEFLPLETTAWTDTTVTGGVSYYYSLVTVDERGRRFGPSPPWAARAINLVPPAAPENLEATSTEASLELAWTAPPEPDVRGYHVVLVRRGADNRRVLLTPDLVTDTAWSLAIPPGTLDSLTVAVRAVSTSFVEGPLSEPVTAAILDTVPPASPILAGVRAGEGRVTVSWVPTTDPDVAGYRVRRSVQGETPAGRPAPPPAEFPVVADGLGADANEYVDAPATPGLLHVFVVEAVDASGNVSPPSSHLAATPYRLGRPAAPGDVEARLAGEDGVRITWEAPASEGVMFYVLERETAGGRFVQLGDPRLADSTSALDAGGRPGHTYRVRAVDTAGNVGPPSEPAPVRE